jgi:diguanylate cyclase (GGDEF)-like protein/PAS domain S-box-containing protein
MAFQFIPPGAALDAATRASRHRGMLVVLALQAVALAGWALALGLPVVHLLVETVPLVTAFAVAASSRVTFRARAMAMALGLFTESALAVHLADGAVIVHFHYFVMLAVLALYEDVAVLALGVAYVVVQHGAMGSLTPEYVYGRDPGAGQPWPIAVVHGLFVLAAAAALMANWRAHAQVRLSDRRHRREAESYMEVAGVMHLLLDPAGRVRIANDMTCATLQRPRDEIVGADWFALAVPEEERAARRAGFEGLIASDAERTQFENRVLCADGSIRRVHWAIALIRDHRGQVTGALSTGTDTTERRAVEARLAREQRDLAGLRRLAQDVASLDDARQAVVERVVGLVDGAFGALVEPSAGDTELRSTAATNEAAVGDRFLFGREPSATVAAYIERRPVFVGDADGNHEVSRRRFEAIGLASALCQPIVGDGGRALGVLVVGWQCPLDELDERTAELVRLAADEAARALMRLGALRRLESAALNDALTGVPNRRAFDEELPRALARAARSGQDVALAYMDLNGFKALNDRDGHAAGDRLLKAATAAWQGELRQSDVLARVGGDEFAVILPNCAPGDVEVVTRRLRTAVPHAPGCGVGVAVWDGVEGADSLMRRADEALYADKAQGARARLSDPVRLAALEATGLLDAPGVPELDELTRVVAWLLDVPSATVSLVDDDRQVFAGMCGITGGAAEERGTPIEDSVCQHPVATGRPLIVTDARENELLRDNAAVRERGVVAYAGIPLVDPSGAVIGVLCAIDDKPRAWSDEDVATLRRLARRAIAEIAARARTGADAPSA